ncbi:polyphenol oxidase family protein [bacterium]|nr:polyphenol oxidase family protein [bacterium]
MKIKNPSDGISIEESGFYIFFGNKSFSQKIETSLPENFCLLNQVHRKECVEADANQKLTADAHWTRDFKKTLVIKTADCLPVMITNSKEKWMLAIHAGWRGVEQKIVSHSIANFKKLLGTDVRVYIGPHIQQQSFEVDLDVAQRILTAHNLDFSSAGKLCVQKDKKFFINLSELVTRELEAFGLSRSHIWTSDIDTKTNSDYYSFRRGDTGVRNYSLVEFGSISTANN